MVCLVTRRGAFCCGRTRIPTISHCWFRSHVSLYRQCGWATAPDLFEHGEGYRHVACPLSIVSSTSVRLAKRHTIWTCVGAFVPMTSRTFCPKLGTLYSLGLQAPSAQPADTGTGQSHVPPRYRPCVPGAAQGWRKVSSHFCSDTIRTSYSSAAYLTATARPSLTGTATARATGRRAEVPLAREAA
jgi:hypothetical protein